MLLQKKPKLQLEVEFQVYLVLFLELLVLKIHYLISDFALSLVLTFGEVILLRFRQVNENVFKVSD